MLTGKHLPQVMLLAIVTAGAASAQTAAPVARQSPTTIDIHGRTLVDPYSWMDDASGPELIAYVEAENRYASDVMQGTEALQRRLFQEMASRLDETDAQPPRFFGRDAYYVRHAPGRQYPLLCRRLGGLKGREEILFDLNGAVRAGKKPALGGWRISPDFRLAALSVDTDGSETFTIFVKSLEGEIKTIQQIAGAGRWFEWGGDSRTLFHTTPYGVHPGRLMRQRVGSSGSPAEEVYAEPERGCGLGLMTTRAGRHLILMTYGAAWEARVLPVDDPLGAFRLLAPRRKGVRYWVSEEGDSFYLLENSAGSGSRIMRTAIGLGSSPLWEEVLPARRGWVVSDFDVAAGKLMAAVRQDGLSCIRVLDLGSGAESAVSFPESPASVRFLTAFERDPQPSRSRMSGSVQFEFGTFVRPRTLFEYHPDTGLLGEIWRAPVPHYRPGDYESRRVFGISPDGTRVPISLVYRKPLVQDGRRPMLLCGFGNAGYTVEPWFETERLSLLDRGVIYGVAHVRGGGEFGPAWHQAATGVNKIRSFTDFCHEIRRSEVMHAEALP